MKFSRLKQIVTEAAHQLKEDAAYSGSWNDGGCENLLNKLHNYQNNWVVKLDLRPSEFNQLNDIDVGEPSEFSNVIKQYKISLAKNIKL